MVFPCLKALSKHRHKFTILTVPIQTRGYTLHLDIASSCFARLKEKRRNLTGRTGLRFVWHREPGSGCGRQPARLQLEQWFSARLPLPGRWTICVHTSCCWLQPAQHTQRPGARPKALSNSFVKMWADTTRWDKLVGAHWPVWADPPARDSSPSPAGPVMRWCKKPLRQGSGCWPLSRASPGWPWKWPTALALRWQGSPAGNDVSIYSHPERFQNG